MPNWKTHIQISKELNKYLNYNEEDFEMFTLGNILPDINNGYLVKDISKIIAHRITHFSQTEVKSYIDFENKYKKYMNRPLIFGYFIHLYADYYWNNNFYTNAKRDNIKLEFGSERDIKQHDFKIYNSKFLENTIQIGYIDKEIEEAKIIKEISIAKNDILEVKNFLDNQKEFNESYKFYTEEELDKLKYDMIESLKEKYI